MTMPRSNKQRFDITEAEAEPEVEPHGVTNDLDRKAMILVFDGGWRCVHAATLPHRKNAQQVVNALLRWDFTAFYRSQKAGRNVNMSLVCVDQQCHKMYRTRT